MQGVNVVVREVGVRHQCSSCRGKGFAPYHCTRSEAAQCQRSEGTADYLLTAEDDRTALNWFSQQLPRNLTVVKGLEIRAALRRPRCSLTSSRISAGLRGRKLNLQLIIAQDRHLIRPWVRHQMRQMMNGYPHFFNLLSKVKAQGAWTRFLLPVASNLSLKVWI